MESELQVIRVPFQCDPKRMDYKASITAPLRRKGRTNESDDMPVDFAGRSATPW